jgi:riboflavin synthase
MFTGIIIESGVITASERKGSTLRLSVRADRTACDSVIGDSVCVNGVCLTVVRINGNIMEFDLSDETLRSTTFARAKKGDRVNIEPSLRPDSKLGGHFVTGHIDGTGTIRSKTISGDLCRFEIKAPSGILHFLVGKGSVAIDGISLTVVEVLQESFTIVIIPHTLQITTIGTREPGDIVNLEADIIGKYVEKFVNKGPARDSHLMETLTKSGFIQ